MPDNTSWNDVVIIPVSFYGDGTRTFKTKKESVEIWNLMCKFLPKNLQRQFKNICYLGSFNKKVSSEEQFKHIATTLKKLENGFWCWNAETKVQQFVICSIAWTSSDLPVGNPMAGHVGPGGLFPCRNCNIHRNQLHNTQKNKHNFTRWTKEKEKYIREQASLLEEKEQVQFLKSNGLTPEFSPFFFLDSLDSTQVL